MPNLRPPPRVALVILVAAALAGCGSGGVASATAPPLPDTTGTPSAAPTPTPTPTPAPTPTPTSSAEGGVVRVPPDDPQGDNTVAADLYPSSGAVTCAARGSLGYGACPVTPRLAERLNEHPIPAAEQLCRCQNQWQGVTINAPPVLPAVGSYTVEVDLQFGGAAVKLDVIVVETSDGFFADDVRCHNGGASTSIYASSPPPC